MNKRLIIIGGGAAGFFCAVNAAKLNPSLKITLLEKQRNVLQKVKVSGGGRCNVTHACFSNAELIKKYPRGKQFLKKAFSHFSTQDTINWFESKGVQLKTESDGRMFPTTDSSQTIIDCLLHEFNYFDLELKLNSEVIDIEKVHDVFTIELKNGTKLQAEYIFIAAGGFPKTSQYDWLKKFNHTIEPPVPSLFTFNIPDKKLHALMGISVENATVKLIGSKLSEQGPLLITHWGLSGPAILKTSAWGARELAERNYEFSIAVNWIDENENQLRDKWNTIRNAQGANKISAKNPFGFQSRLWIYFLEEVGINIETKWSELNAKDQNKLIHVLTSQEFSIKGKTTFKEEFVTCGGISLNEVDPHTMQSKLITNLYFGGEILDIDGVTGGFNFQNAWTSGFLAAKNIAE